MTKLATKQATINIDGQEVKVPEGTPLIEAAAQIGIKIPHLCYCPSVKSTGACRLCLVELEGSKNLIVSCARTAKDGMEIRTSTPRVLDARRFAVDLILSNHPGECLSCDKSGTCNLQDAAYMLGIEQTSYPMKDPGYPVDDSNPFIERNYRLCVLCGRCIRICTAQGANILEFMERGMTTRVATAGEKPLQDSGCDFCGSCVSVCPTAALLEQDRRSKGREWQLNTTESSCAFCGSGCSAVISTANGQVLRATGAAIEDYLCAKGRFGWTYLESEARLTKPLVRKDGELVEASWEEALDFAAKRLAEIKKSHGADSIGGMIKATATSEEIYAFQSLFRDSIGTNNIDSSARLYSYLTQTSLRTSFGSQIIAGGADIEAADQIVVIGADVTVDYPFIGAKIKRAMLKSAKVYAIDARTTDIAGRAELHLQPKAGTEALLLAGIAKAVLKSGNYGKAFVGREVENFDKLTSYLDAVDEAQVAAKTGVELEAIQQLAALLGDSKKKSVLVFPAENNDRSLIQGIKNILLLTGNVKKAAVPAMLLSNLEGAFAFGGAADLLPGNKQAEGKPGLTALEMVKAAGDQIKAMVLFGENPLGYFPGGRSNKSKLEALDFLVVQDVFLSDAAKLADVVLPAATFVEASGTRINAEHQVVKQNAAVESGVKAGWEIVAELAAGLGSPLAGASFSKLTKDVKDTWRDLQKTGKQGAYAFDVAQYTASREELSKEYPLSLMLGGTTLHFHDAHLTRNSKFSLLEDTGENYIGLSRADAEKNNIVDGSRVVVSSRTGRIECNVMIQDSLSEGLVFAPRWNQEAYELFDQEVDAESKTPLHRLAAVAVEAKKGEV